MRNLELLRDVECIEISMKEYRPDHGPLQQQKVYTQFHLFSGVVFHIMDLNQKRAEQTLPTETDPGLDLCLYVKHYTL